MKRYHSRLSIPQWAILLAMLAVLSFVVTSTTSIVEAQTTPAFQQSELQGIVGMGNPTTLQFGPDGRLYVAERFGTIFVLTIARNGPGDYVVTSQENIELIWQDIANRTDDTGAVDTSSAFLSTNRQITGLYVTGTASNPVIYVSSSDPREGGGSGGEDLNLDTNSGVLSRLTWTGTQWNHVQLVRGLPRSEENHSVNGMALDESTNTMYLAVGGFTNMGAPSFNFTFIPEYALSAAILAIDLDAIGSTTYDLPTLDDPTRVNLPDGSDPNDPFGGNDGLNQAVIVPGGPVQVYASGFRNPYDVVITQNGRMYSIDNGPNYNWGGPTVDQTPGQCDNTSNENNSNTFGDNLHYITGQGYYAGHPNPVRANPEGIYGVGNEADSPVPYALANPVECDYRVPGSQDGALAVWSTSTNGLAEYTAGNFSGEMQGDLLTVSYDGNVYRMKPNGSGDALIDLDTGSSNDYEALFGGFGIVPLDVTTQGDTDIFPGTIWVAVFVNQTIAVFEPVDFICTGDDNALLDEDADGFDNADELDNGTNPCSNGSRPPDNDGDFESDLNDDDDDNDGILDINDFFQIDPQNGVQTTLPVRYDFYQDDPGTGFFGVGFTGMMVNYATDYLDMFNLADLTIGGTAGKATIDNFTDGTALNGTNTQDYAYQWGVNVTSADGTFGINAQMNNPFFSPTPEAGDEQGIYFGNGDMDNYFELALAADDATGDIGFEVIVETAGVANRTFYPVPGAESNIKVNLYLTIDPAAGTVQPKYSLDGAPYVNLGSPITVTGELLNVLQTNQVMAVGLMAHFAPTAATPFGGTWDYVFIDVEQPGVLGSNPETHDFGQILQGATRDQTFILTNLGQSTGQDIGITSMSISGSTNFVVLTDPSPVTLGPGETTAVTVRYAPSPAPGETNDAATLVINHDGTNNPLNVDVTGSSLVDYEPIYRVNVGGAVLVDPDLILNWSADSSASPSPYANHAVSASYIFVTAAPIDYSSPTLPSYTPTGLFNPSRYDFEPPTGTAAEMEYAFPVEDGTYQVRLYLAETFNGVTGNGLRVFDAEVEGTVPPTFNDIDRFALGGGLNRGFMVSADVLVTDGTLNIRFLHQVENPDVQGIEILPISLIPTSDLIASSTAFDYGTIPAGVDATQVITLTNDGDPGDPSITINSITYSGVDAADFSDDIVGTPVLLPGESLDVTITLNPSSGGAKTAVATIDHDGDNEAIDVTLQAFATSNGELELSPAPFDFGQVAVGESLTLPLTLTNLGELTDSDIEVTNLVVSGADTYQFQYEPYANPLIVPAGQSITVDVTFTPAQTGIYNVTLAATHDGTNSPATVAATAEGVAPIGDPIFRINVGGPTIADPGGVLNWSQDLTTAASPYYTAGGQGYFATGNAINMSNPSIPPGTPSSLFQTERWDPAGGSELSYEFPVPAGTYEVHIYLSENYPATVNAPGLRVFDASLEGVVPPAFEDIDPFALGGAAYTATMVSARVTVADGSLSLQFLHQVENPAVKAIEIYDLDADGILGTNPATHDFGDVLVGETQIQVITLSNDGAGGAPPLTINSISFGTTEFTSDFVGPVTLNQSETLDVTVSFTPPTPANYSDTMTIVHTGVNTPTTVGLTGTGSEANLLSQDVTSIDFGNILVNTNNDGTFTLTNLGTTGDPDITITELNFSGTNAGDFSHSETLPLVIAPGASEIIDISLLVGVDGPVTAQLTIVNSGVQGDLIVDLTATAATPAPGSYQVAVAIVPTGNIDTATTASRSFIILNNSTGGQEIVSVSFDISSAIVPDVVFDPTGTAGDDSTVCLIPEASDAASTGYIAPADACVDPFSSPYDLGYRVVTLNFNDFRQSETMIFRVDTDPTSVRGLVAPGPDNAGHISGYELIGSEVTIEFNDGTILTTELWRNASSVTASINNASNTVLATPSIEVVGIATTPTTVGDVSQTIRVTGPAGAQVSLLVSEGDMVDPAAYDVDAFELNTILNVQEYTDTIGAGGTVDIPITLLDDELIDGTYGGKNIIVAVIRDTSISQTSALSNRIVLEYVDTPVQDITFAGDISTTAQEGQTTTVNELLGTGTSDASTPTIDLTAVDDATGLAPTWLSLPGTVVAGNDIAAMIDVATAGLAPGTYTATVTGASTGYNSATFAVTLVVNDLDVAITSPADAANIVGTDVAVTWTGTSGIGTDLMQITLDDSVTPVVVDSQSLADTYTFTGVAPGTYDVTVQMTDASLNIYQGVSQTITITVVAPPDPDILFSGDVSQTAQEGQSVNVNDAVTVTTGDATTPTVNLNAIDDATGLAPTWLTIPATITAGNNVPVEINPLGLAVGTHTATVTGSAPGYNDGTFTVTIVVNDITVAITAPTNGINIVGTDIVVTWTSTGGLVDDHIHVTLDDLSTPAVEPHIGSLPQNDTTTITGVAPGSYRVIVEMANVNHIVYQGTAVSVDITVSSAPLPDLIFASNLNMTAQEGQGLSITDSVALSTSDASAPAVTLSAIDNGTGLAPTWLSVPTAGTAGTNVAVDVNVLGLAPGTYTATVTATAAGYNSANFTVTVVVNDLTITLTSPADGLSFRTSDTITISWTSTGGLGDDEVVVYIDNLATPAREPAAGTFGLNASHNISGLTDGSYAIIVEMANYGIAYQGVSDTVNFTISNPALAFGADVAFNAQQGQAPINSTITTSATDASTPTIALAAVDNITGLAPTWLSIPASVVAGNDIAFSIDVTGLVEGNYSATVTGTATGYTTDSFIISLSVVDPELTFGADVTFNAQAGQALVISSTAATGTNDASTPTINISAVDNFTQIAPTWLTIPANVVAGSDIAYDINVAGLAPRTYTATITGTAAGFGTQTFTITLVVADVDVTITNPAPFASILSNEITVNWTTTGSIATDTIRLTLDDLSTGAVDQVLPNQVLNGSRTFSGVLLTDYEIIIQLMDNQGRPYYGAEHRITVSADPTSPIPAAVTGAVTPTGTINNAYPSFTWTPVTNATWYYFFINTPNAGSHTEWVNAGEFCTATLCTYIPVTPFEDGVYEWAVKTSNANGHGPWSDVWDLTITGGNISTVTVIDIPDSASVNPTFTWNTELGASWYRLLVQGPAGIIHDQWYHESEVCVFADCAATPALYISPGTYTYWVQPWGYAYVYGPWSPSQDVVMNGPVTLPVLQTPMATIVGAQPTFTWTQPPGSNWHYLWIELDDGTIMLQEWFDSATYCDGTTCVVTPAALNLADGDYNWWVHSWGVGYGYTGWSTPGTFTVDIVAAGAIAPPPAAQSGSVQQPAPTDPSNPPAQPPPAPTNPAAVVPADPTSPSVSRP